MKRQHAPVNPTDALDKLLGEALAPARPVAVVDVGANPIDGEPPYRPLLEKGLCTVVGFEPQPEALAALRAAAGPSETYLEWALGDGGSHRLHRCRAPGMTSLLEPDPQNLKLFNDFSMLGEVVTHAPIGTYRLDDVSEIQAVDFLKIDVQGSELAVFDGGREKLERAVVVQTEASFVPLYRDQPVLWQTDRALRSLGLIPHAFATIKRWPIAPYVRAGDPREPLNQLLEADLIYVRDFTRDDAMDDEQLKHLALIAHHCYGSFDLVLRCLALLAGRGRLANEAVRRYAAVVQGGAAPAGPAERSDLSFDIQFTMK